MYINFWPYLICRRFSETFCLRKSCIQKQRSAENTERLLATLPEIVGKDCCEVPAFAAFHVGQLGKKVEQTEETEISY